MKTKSSKKAFSIVELSIAVLIIASLIGAIVSANRILFNSRLATAQSLTKYSPVNDIDNLALWYETTMPKSLSDASSDNNTAIAGWNDLGPNRINATATNAPTYIADGINSLPVLRFNGSSNYLSYNGSFLVGTNYTIFIVYQRRAAQSNAYLLAGTSSSTNQNLHVGYSANTTTIFNQFNNDLSATVAGYLSPIPEIDVYWFNSAVGKNLYVNGASIIASTTAPAQTGLSTSYPGASIGGRASGNNFSGDIAEIIMFTKALSTQERKDVEQYLGKKWGITVS